VPQLEQCAAAAPDDAELHADLGAAYLASARVEDAERSFRRALQVDPDFADVHVKLASLLAARGAMTDAREHAEAALRLQPNRAAVQQLLAQIGSAAERRP
jgi:protein O-GlcNAc transferase